MNESLRWLGSIGCLALVACGAGAGEGSTEDGVLRDSLGKELSPISAQIVRANPSSEVGAALLARLEVQPNELVEFHELEPGVLAISGSGRPSSAPRGEGTVDSLSDVRAVWAALSANAAMPEALEQALARADSMPPQEEPAEAAEVSASRAPAADAQPGDRVPLHLPIDGAAHTSSAWCDDEYYSAEDGGFALNLSDPNERKLSACLSTNLYPKVQCFDHVTGDWTASAKGSFQKANVCPYRGQLTWTLRVKGETRLVKTVLENTVHWNTVKHRGGTSTMTVVLSNASGDGYQFRFFGG